MNGCVCPYLTQSYTQKITFAACSSYLSLNLSWINTISEFLRGQLNCFTFNSLKFVKNHKLISFLHFDPTQIDCVEPKMCVQCGLEQPSTLLTQLKTASQILWVDSTFNPSVYGGKSVLNLAENQHFANKHNPLCKRISIRQHHT